MASIRKETELNIDADRAWAALSDFGNAGAVFAGPLVDCRRDGDVRKVTFANGLEATERLVAVDHRERRIVHTVEGGLFAHHNGAMQILENGRTCKFVWVTDFLPDDMGARILPLIEEGCRAIRRNLSAGR